MEVDIPVVTAIHLRVLLGVGQQRRDAPAGLGDLTGVQLGVDGVFEPLDGPGQVAGPHRPRHAIEPVDVETGIHERRRVIPAMCDAVLVEPVAQTLLAIGGFERAELVPRGGANALGDVVLDGHQCPHGLGGETALGEHGQLALQLGAAVPQAGDGAADRRGRVVELMCQARGDGAEAQQPGPLAEDLLLAQAAERVAGQQMHRHRELVLHEPGELLGIEHEEPGRANEPYRDCVGLFRVRHVRRPRPAVRAALRSAVRLHVDAGGAARHHQFAVDQYVEARRRIALTEQRPGRKSLDTALGAQRFELRVPEVLEQEQGAQLVNLTLLAHRHPQSS